ncbi:MAG: TRAP transporter permease, partial [Proteobacteria bacterium]|nr:TRAP transporter permease [Pseudomonadota bacterium]
MDPQKTDEMDEGVETAKRIAEESEFGSRKLSGFSRYLIPVIAAAWSLFQLSLPEFIMLDSVLIRCIHLGFAILLVYFCHPAFKKRKTKGIFNFLSQKAKLPFADLILGVVAAGSALYLAINYDALNLRQGAPSGTDIIVGIVLILLLLEAAR